MVRVKTISDTLWKSSECPGTIIPINFMLGGKMVLLCARGLWMRELRLWSRPMGEIIQLTTVMCRIDVGILLLI